MKSYATCVHVPLDFTHVQHVIRAVKSSLYAIGQALRRTMITYLLEEQNQMTK